MSVRTTDRRASRSRPLALLAIPVLSATFGYIGGTAVDEQLPLAGFGLLWGAVAMVVAPRLAVRGAQSAGQANAPVYVMTLLAFAVLGASIVVHLLGPNPAEFLELVQRSAYGLFFYSLHGPVEWVLMPWALMVNWRQAARRRLLVAAAMCFYLGRVASALYFAPAALHWVEDPVDAATDIDDVDLWMRLDLLRLVVQDIVTATLVSLAALHPRYQPRPMP